MTIAEQIAALDQRIRAIEESTATLQHEIGKIDTNTAAHVRLQDLIVMGERALAELRRERAKLTSQGES